MFAFGGARANSTVYTAAINTLFLREHNRLCKLIEDGNSSWDDERVFQTARNVSIVQLIKIVVEEYVNHISPYWFKMLAEPSASYKARWNRENWIPVEFNVLYRWHSLIPEKALWRGAAINMVDARFDNRLLIADGLNNAFLSMSAIRAWQIGLFNTAAMLGPVEHASLQQGRDNELARFNDYREAMKYPRMTDFSQISSNPLVVSGLKSCYGANIDDLEYFALVCRGLGATCRRSPTHWPHGGRRCILPRFDQSVAGTSRV